MDRLTLLNPIQKRRNLIGIFAGLNKTETIQDNEFQEMKNLSSDEYPAASCRKPRGEVQLTLETPHGLYWKNGLAYVDGTDFCYNGEIRGTVEDSDKTMVGMGAYIVIWPDKKIFNTSTNEFESIEYTWSQEASATVAPTYDASTYTKITCTGIGAGFKKGDGVTISGITARSSGGDDVLNGSKIIQEAGDDFIVIIGQISSSVTQASGITVTRTAPDMDYICEQDNRLYGCSSANHEIYACKLGDPKNWNAFEGVSTDSYAATVGSDGDFTGCISFMGYVLFFKEECIHKLYGNKPANMQLNSYPYRGVAAGCSKTLCVVNETLYYAASNAIMRYDGAIPESISDRLGKLTPSKGAAGFYSDKYFCSIDDGEAGKRLLVYDTRRQMWHEEDDTVFQWAVHGDGDLHFINADNELLTIQDEDGSERVQWYGISGQQMEGDMNRKRITKLQMMVEADIGTLFEVFISYDGNPLWERAYTKKETDRCSHQVSITPKKCNYFRYKIKGIGPFKLLGIAKLTQIMGTR